MHNVVIQGRGRRIKLTTYLWVCDNLGNIQSNININYPAKMQQFMLVLLQGSNKKTDMVQEVQFNSKLWSYYSSINLFRQISARKLACSVLCKTCHHW